MTPKRITLLIIAALLVGAFALFYLQNAGTRVNLIYKLPGGLAWDLGPDGVALPILLSITFGLGAGIVGSVMGTLMGRSARRARLAQREVDSLQDELDFLRSDANRSQGRSRVADEPPMAADSSFDDLI
jgi:ABC-type Fe3+ transport system permease subunit